MIDFKVNTYRQLLNALIAENYSFQTFEEFLKQPKERVIILRHDVDRLPGNSLTFAKIQNSKGIKGVYYFRSVPESWDETIIKEIASLGHEIGYHYECLTTCKGNLEMAIKDFETNLYKLRKLAPVKTICMHGSPMSKYDSKQLWQKYSYKNFDILAEPYFDLDFTKIFYLTDTGRRWDGDKMSIRDKVSSGFNLSFHSTYQIIRNANQHLLPDKIMMTFHPQRWSDNIFMWTKELVSQNIKNIVKLGIVKLKS